MSEMHAAVVTSFDEPPHYLPFETPVPPPGTELVDVLAAALHPRVRSGAAGRHYSSTGELPLVPGVDAVGRTADGRLVYFGASDDRVGTMADQAVLDPRRAVALPPDTDVISVAAALNPAMASWVALRRRTSVADGRRVAVLGATGSAGSMACRLARHMGAGHVIGVGRDQTRLAALERDGSADVTVTISADPQSWTAELAACASEVDVVLDFVWGEPTQAALPAVLRAREDRSVALDWVEIGAVAGPDITLPAAALRSTNLRLLGSGQGGIGVAEYLAELPSLVEAMQHGVIGIDTQTAALSEVESVWTRPEQPGVRTVLVP